MTYGPKVKIETIDTNQGVKLKLTSEFHPELSGAVKAVGGKWSPKSSAWYFDPRDKARVREIASRIYGTDDSATAKTVDVRVRLSWHGKLGYGQEVWMLGRLIAKRPGRDDLVALGDGVVIIEGEFARIGGSVKNPSVMNNGSGSEWVVLEVRDVPAGHVDLAHERVEVVAPQAQPSASVPSPVASGDLDLEGATIEELIGIRERLLAQVERIDALLPEPTGTEMTAREAAVALGVSVRTVQRWAASGRVDAVKDARGRWTVTIVIGG